ncbi:MAG TPA: bifunctional 4-hydroxy-2-oxoglutarate aldolase/2-dehydro-3-deoxy-phosphogluconate aldolase, partial [Anaerolineales bacterium]|nr:bifunctional 4-hydroxy-2-oxoglutarate aldolase/2-dehydro-3-deoxy-phosphogluconate aldolase [Anaerolineales bacterium]
HNGKLADHPLRSRQMGKDDHVREIEQGGVIAIVRFDRSEDLIQVARAIQVGGVRAIEFTMTTPNAIQIIQQSVREFGEDVLLGAGTVLDAETARAAILAGAEFIVAPTLNPAVIEVCRRYSKVVIPGAFTPTEILTAWECGADFVKVFPAEFGGPAYFKAVLAPLPQVKLVPVGGVSLETAGDFIRAGAAAVAVGSNLVKKSAIAAKRFDELTELARSFAEAVRTAREA